MCFVFFVINPSKSSTPSTLCTAAATGPYHLTEEQKKFYHENGYLLGLPPIYTKAEMAKINAELPNLLALLGTAGETSKEHP